MLHKHPRHFTPLSLYPTRPHKTPSKDTSIISCPILQQHIQNHSTYFKQYTTNQTHTHHHNTKLSQHPPTKSSSQRTAPRHSKYSKHITTQNPDYLIQIKVRPPP